MAITIPDITKIRLTTGVGNLPDCGQILPGVASVAITNPGPVAAAAAGLNSAGQPQLVQAAGDAGRKGYYGYNIKPNAGAGEPISPVRGAMVEGFAGAQAGDAVYVDATSADAGANASGLTHTLPVTGDVRTPIGVAVSATKIRFT